MCTPVSQEKARDGSEEVVGNGHGDDGRVLLPPPGDEAIVHWGIIQIKLKCPISPIPSEMWIQCYCFGVWIIFMLAIFDGIILRRLLILPIGNAQRKEVMSSLWPIRKLYNIGNTHSPTWTTMLPSMIEFSFDISWNFVDVHLSKLPNVLSGRRNKAQNCV